MEFSLPRPRRNGEPALPMINVVFLLLIFFLMSAQIAAPPPLDVAPPRAEHSESPRTDLRLFISADGTLGLGDISGSAALAALAATPGRGDATLLIRADAALPAQTLAAVLARLSALGFGRVQLATIPQ